MQEPAALPNASDETIPTDQQKQVNWTFILPWVIYFTGMFLAAVYCLPWLESVREKIAARVH